MVEKEVPGFVENRVLYAIMRECLDLVDRGIVSPEALDLNVRWGIGYKLAVIGPMALLDMAGHGHLRRGRVVPEQGPLQPRRRLVHRPAS